MITKDESQVLRGIAILFIALHNFCHLLGYAKENEKSFHLERWEEFFMTLTHPSIDIIWHIFSFLGWIGVPVFIFLSGYGLVMKYEVGRSPLIVKDYILTNFKKLFWLMLPGVCFFILWSFLQCNFVNGIKKILYLTLINNIFYPVNPFAPGVYWYFGFTFQLYIIYLLFYHNRNKQFLIYSFALSTVMLLLLPNSIYGQVALSYLKNNFIGWLSVFLLGIYAGRFSNQLSKVFFTRKWALLVFSLCCFIFAIILNCNYYLWHFLPFMSLLMFIPLAKVIEKDNVVGRFIFWLGEHSSSVFVIHPIARTLTMELSSIMSLQHICLLVSIYLSIVVILAFYYAKLYKILRLRFAK